MTQLEPSTPGFDARSRTDPMQEIRVQAASLSDTQKEAFAKELGSQVGPPDQTTSNTVWLIIIWAFVSVMVVSVLTLCITVFYAPVTGGTAPDKILTVFTTVTAFLAGLFAPSPVGGGKKG